jgi:hypothetical protein
MLMRETPVSMRSRRRRHQTRQDSNADRTREAHAHSTARVGDLPIHVLLLHGGYAAVPCVYESRLGSKPRSRQDSNGGRTREAHAHSTARAGHHTTHLLLLHGDDAAVPCACVKFRHNCMKSTPRHGWFAKPLGVSCQKKTCQTEDFAQAVLEQITERNGPVRHMLGVATLMSMIALGKDDAIAADGTRLVHYATTGEHVRQLKLGGVDFAEKT